MTETIKKAKPAAKPRKTATKKKSDPVTADPIAINSHEVQASHTNGHRQSTVTDEDVARLAHRYWKERGHKHGNHEDDWYRAERELRGMAS